MQDKYHLSDRGEGTYTEGGEENSMIKTFKVIPLETLKRLNREAIAANRNMTLEPKVLNRYPAETKFPVAQGFFHNDGEMRVVICVDDDDNTAMIDMGIKDYNALPIEYFGATDDRLTSLAHELDEAFGG